MSWAINPQMVAVFGKVIEPSVCRALVEEVGNQRRSLKSNKLHFLYLIGFLTLDAMWHVPVTMHTSPLALKLLLCQVLGS